MKVPGEILYADHDPANPTTRSSGNDGLSVVITFYNKGEALRDAVESAVDQLQPNDELILVNDSSDDPQSIEVLRSVSQSSDRIALYHTTERGGSSVSKDLGIRKAQNEIIVLLDADDLLPAGALKSIRECFSKSRDASFAFGDYIELHSHGGETCSLRIDCSALTDQNGWMAPRRLARNWRLLGTSPFRRSAYLAVGGFDPVHPRMDDKDFFRKLIAAGHRGRYIPEIVYIWNRTLSSNNYRLPPLEQHLSWFRCIEFYARTVPLMEFQVRLIWRGALLLLAVVRYRQYLRPKRPKT